MEIWKDIQGYEGLYKISNMGNVLSLKYRHHDREKLLTLRTDINGYKDVCLTKDRIETHKKVHRLVAEAFIENDNPERTFVNHIDGNKSNNNVDNLEWCTRSENMLHAYKTGLMPKHVPKIKNRKKVKCLETNTTYESLTEASEKLGIHISKISQCCHGVRKHTHNLHFSFV